jgi:hypothetical protein
MDDSDNIPQYYIINPIILNPHLQPPKAWFLNIIRIFQIPFLSRHIPESEIKDYRDIFLIIKILNQFSRSAYPIISPVHKLSEN